MSDACTCGCHIYDYTCESCCDGPPPHELQAQINALEAKNEELRVNIGALSDSVIAQVNCIHETREILKKLIPIMTKGTYVTNEARRALEALEGK